MLGRWQTIRVGNWIVIAITEEYIRNYLNNPPPYQELIITFSQFRFQIIVIFRRLYVKRSQTAGPPLRNHCWKLATIEVASGNKRHLRQHDTISCSVDSRLTTGYEQRVLWSIGTVLIPPSDGQTDGHNYRTIWLRDRDRCRIMSAFCVRGAARGSKTDRLSVGSLG